MSDRDYRLFVKDILDSITKIQKYLEGVSYDRFVEDEKTIDAVVRNFEIIGEAANNLPQDIKNKCSDIPWREVIGMRNKIIHEYFGVDTDIVWETAFKFLPSVKSTLENLTF